MLHSSILIIALLSLYSNRGHSFASSAYRGLISRRSTPSAYRTSVSMAAETETETRKEEEVIIDSPARESFYPFSTTTSNTALTYSSIIASVVIFAMMGAAVAADGSTAASLNQIFDPSQFQPVCPASDGVYNVLKITANTLVGQENVIEYGPLIASVLLRVRLELCVLESFVYEAVVPFIKQKGISWILPLHETVETFLAGTIFAVASNFILLGSTKILSILLIYADTITGMPTRFIGKNLKKSAPKASPGNIIGTGIKAYGDVLGTVRNIVEAGDTFVGRYLVVATTAYIIFKFAHYKLFNDFAPEDIVLPSVSSLSLPSLPSSLPELPSLPNLSNFFNSAAESSSE